MFSNRQKYVMRYDSWEIPEAARENLEAVLPALAHGLEMLSGRPADCAGLTD